MHIRYSTLVHSPNLAGNIPIFYGCYGDMNDFLEQNESLNLFPNYHIVHNLGSSLGEEISFCSKLTCQDRY